jgi:DNA primase
LRAGVRVTVATLPEGEDPDTLVRKGGSAAFEAAAKDAMDLLERKIRILEQKGLFRSITGRRRAVDRLLPTIRAANDALTRELYLSRAADAAGIRKESLSAEVQGLLDVHHQPRLSRNDNASPPPVLPNDLQKALIQLVLVDSSWRERVLDQVEAQDFEDPTYRSIYEALSEDRLDGLDDVTAAVAEGLREEVLAALNSELFDADSVFERAVNDLQANRVTRFIELRKREIPFLSEDEKLSRVREIAELTKQRNTIKPVFGLIEKAKRRRSGAPGS